MEEVTFEDVVFWWRLTEKSKTEKWAFTSKINISQDSLVNNLLYVLDKQIIGLQVNIRTIILYSVNRGERYEHMIDHPSCIHNLQAAVKLKPKNSQD